MDLAEQKRYYSDLISRFGPTAQGVGWNGAERSQNIRFHKLTDSIDIEGIRRVLDVGCGYGAMESYLRKRGFEGYYYGIDNNLKAIEMANGGEKSEYLHKDIMEDHLDLPPAEYVFISGLFAFFDEQEMHQVLLKLSNMFTKGLCFNFILGSGWSWGESADGDYIHNPSKIMGIVQEVFPTAGTVRFDSRYLGMHDCAVQVML